MIIHRICVIIWLDFGVPILNSEKSDNDYTDVIGDKILTFMVELIMIILIGWLNMVLNSL